MSNPNFEPTYSTNEIWRDADTSRCLTDDLDNIEADIATLETSVSNIGNSYAPINHTHSEYAAVDHTHTGYAAANHTHTGYASTDDVTALQTAVNNKADANHTHTGYAAASHNHDDSYYTEAEVDTLLSGKASTSHTHTVDSALSSTSTNPVQNSVVKAALDGKVPTSRTVNGKALSANITLSASDVGADASGSASSALTSANNYTDSAVSTKASASDLTSHTGNSTVHITSTERSNWNAAKTHADTTHAPSNAEVNQNAFSNIAVGSTTIAAGGKTDTVTLVAGDNVTLSPSTSSKSVTISATDTTYTHPTTSGNKHIPSGGSDGQILRWSSDGTAAWGADGGEKIVTTAGTGAAYTATVEGIDSLTAGVSFVMIPHTVSTATVPTLNVNGLGAKNLRRRLSNSTTSTVPSASANWLGSGKPIRVTYDGNFWIPDFMRPNANDIYGSIAVANGGTGATDAATARTNLDVYSKAEVEALIQQAIANL